MTRPSRPVRCIETDEVFDSAQAAADALGCCVSNVYDTLRGSQKMSCGLHFEYFNDFDLMMDDRIYADDIKVMKIGGKWWVTDLDGKILKKVGFSSPDLAYMAAHSYDIDRQKKPFEDTGYIPDKPMGRKPTKERKIKRRVWEPKGRPGRPVICTTTGEKYESVSAAAKAKGIRYSTNIKRAIIRHGVCYGLEWAYQE